MAAPDVAGAPDDEDDDGEVESEPEIEEKPATETGEDTDSGAEPSGSDGDIGAKFEEIDDMADEYDLNPEGVTTEDIEEGNAGIQQVDMTGDSDDSGSDEDALNDFFDGDASDGSSASADGDSTDEAASDELTGMEKQVVEGAAQLAVSGLEPGDEKDVLREDFETAFDKFGLGSAGADFVDEYIAVEMGDEEIDPAWRLTGAMMLCAIVVINERPDGQELAGSSMTKVADGLGKIRGGN